MKSLCTQGTEKASCAKTFNLKNTQNHVNAKMIHVNVNVKVADECFRAVFMDRGERTRRKLKKDLS